MRRRGIAVVVTAVYTWVAMVAFGGIAMETIIIYPNVFADVPESLARATEFFAATAPADLFRPLGGATVVAAVATAALTWPDRTARWWIGASLVTLLGGEFLFSALYFWPRNVIMFEEGTAVHSAEFLRQTAAEFQTAHWGRLAMSGVTATLAFTGLLRLHRAHVTSDE